MIPNPRTGRWFRGLAVLLFLACIVVAACTKRDPQAAGQRRIVAIGGAVTELVYALGAGADVVAVDSSSVFPPETSTQPVVGYQRTLGAEGILAREPDVVIASDEAGPPAVLEQLRAAGVRVSLVKAAVTADEAIARIHAVGAALGGPAVARADALARQVTADVAAVRATLPAGHEGRRFALVYARGGGTLMLSGAKTAGVATLELAGGVNAITGFDGFAAFSPESLVAAAPDVIVIPTRGLASMGGEAALLAAPGVAETPAGRAHRIVAIDDLLLLGLGPRLPLAISTIAAGFASAPTDSTAQR